MDTPTLGQLPYKLNAVLRSDQHVSGRGMSIYRVLLNDFFKGRDFWSVVMTEENEGRWGQPSESRREILQYIDFPMGLLSQEHAALGPNPLAAAGMFIRAGLKPNSW